MKNAFFSLFLFISLVYCFAQLSNAAVTCGNVNMKAASCITFATGKLKTPPPACCSGLQALAQGVKTVDDKKAICRCLKAGVKNFAGVQDRFLSQIPNACKIKVGFPVSTNTDCENSTEVDKRFEVMLGV
ncbi:hypothetical protein CASFOL_001595 [Castilleja foliolosa]|uniref:Non-specific lipid-transfer protein n=1 Tax=Castilleja foliolosa TaxID=1961234 RepID=A0ABD3ENB6_9LAMI